LNNIVTLKSLSELLRVIQNCIIRKLGYGFLFVFPSNCGSLLYRFRDKVSYWSKLRLYHTRSAFDTPIRGVAVGVLPYHWYRKTRIVSLPDGEKSLWMFSRFDRIPA